MLDRLDILHAAQQFSTAAVADLDTHNVGKFPSVRINVVPNI